VLILPILVWNVVCTRFLPPALASTELSRAIPPLVTYGENTLRIVVMTLPFLVPLEVATAGNGRVNWKRRGLRLFAVGTLLYLLSWIPLMTAPQSEWSTSWLGFAAPANTRRVWLTGLWPDWPSALRAITV
jgi:hypothetical protein